MHSPLLAKSWKCTFDGALPAGFLLRQHFPDRWLRVHSLPEAKRYPSCAAEYEEILNRHNTVAAYVLGEGSKCSVFIARFGRNREWSDASFLALVGGMPSHVFESEDPDEPIQFLDCKLPGTGPSLTNSFAPPLTIKPAQFSLQTQRRKPSMHPTTVVLISFFRLPPQSRLLSRSFVFGCLHARMVCENNGELER